MSKFSTRRLALVAAASTSLMVGGLTAGLTAGSASAARTHAGSSATTLVVESSPESTVTQDFNPYVPTGDIYNMGATGLIYEPLIEFDLAAPPKNYPWLATSYKWGAGGKSITFTIRKGVDWSDGTPFTPADVAFTFNLMKKNASINLSGLDISSVSTSGDTVTVSFPTAQYANLQYIGGVGIVPEHIWSSVGNPATYTDANPVGTGPYVLKSFTPEGVTLSVNPHYWGTKPAVQNVYFPAYTSNTGATAALFSNQIDWTGNFIPGLEKNFVDKAPAYHHYWEAPGSTNALMVNLHQWPTNQLAVRQAINVAVNRTVVASEGEAGLENPVLNKTGLTLPTFSAWSGPVASLVNSPVAQPGEAKSILEKAGYKLNGSGYFEKNGKVVSVTLIAPSAYTDYAEDGSIIAGELKQAGIEATFDGLTVNAWNQDVASGNFSISEHWSNNGLTPYALYDNWLNSALDTKAATGDYERVNNPAIDADLDQLAGAPTVAAQTAALTPIAKFVASYLPVIPLTTASEWFEYNSDHFVGWPTQQNPYETGQPSGTNNGTGSGTNLVVVLHLKPRS